MADKSGFITKEIQKYVDDHALKMNQYQKKLHAFSMTTGFY